MTHYLNLLIRLGASLSLLAGAFSAEAMMVGLDALQDDAPAHFASTSSAHGVREDLEAKKQAFFSRLQDFTPENVGEMRHVFGFIENRVPSGTELSVPQKREAIRLGRQWVHAFDLMLNPQGGKALETLMPGKTQGEIYQEGLVTAQSLLGQCTPQKQAEVLQAHGQIDPELIQLFDIVNRTHDIDGKKFGHTNGIQYYKWNLTCSSAKSLWPGSLVPFRDSEGLAFQTQFVDMLSLLPAEDKSLVIQGFRSLVDANGRAEAFMTACKKMRPEAPWSEQRVLYAALLAVGGEKAFETLTGKITSFETFLSHMDCKDPLDPVYARELAARLYLLAHPEEKPEAMRALELKETLQRDFGGMIAFDGSKRQRMLLRTLFTEMKPYLDTQYYDRTRSEIKESESLKQQEQYYALLGEVMNLYAELDDAQRATIQKRMVAGRQKIEATFAKAAAKAAAGKSAPAASGSSQTN